MKDKYVFYDVDGERFSVRESEMSEFEKDFPNAIINMSVDGENFPVKLSEREDFLKDFGEGASYTNFDEQEEPKIKTDAVEQTQKPKKDSLNNILTSVNDSLMRAQHGASKTFDDANMDTISSTPQGDNTSWGESLAKGAGAGFTRAGKGLLDALTIISSNNVYVDPMSANPIQMLRTGKGPELVKTPDYDTLMREKEDPMIKASLKMGEVADRLSKEADPTHGEKSFVDLISEGKIGMALQKGLATGAESLPMTLSAYNPYTMALNMVSMAGANYAEETLNNPEVDKWKRATQAIGSAALEQAVEKFADPIFKYIGGGATGEFTETMAREILEDGINEATEGISKRIFNVIKNAGKDALGEGGEEVITSFGNDLLGEALDLIDGDKDYGIRAQWEQMKEENPDANLGDFAKSKAKEYMDSFIGGALSGAYMSGTTQTLSEASQYASDIKSINAMNAAHELGASMNYGDLYDVDSDVNDAKAAMTESFVSEAGDTVLSAEFIDGLSSEDAFALSRSENVSAEQRGALAKYALEKAKQESLNKKLDENLENNIATARARIEGVTENGQVVSGMHNGKVVYVTGGVVNNGAVTLPNGENGPVLVVDSTTGDKMTVRSEEISSASTIDSQKLIGDVETFFRNSEAQNRDAARNTMSVRAKHRAIQPYAGKKILVDLGNGTTEVFVQKISNNGDVVIKGKKGDLGGQSILTLSSDVFYDSIYRDGDGNPVVTEAGPQEAEQEAPQEQTPETEVPQTPVEPTEPADFRDFADTIMVNGKRIKVDEVTAQDDVSDSITYRYTDENGVQRTGNMTIGAFAEAVNLGRQQTETPTPVPAPEPVPIEAVGETPVPTMETPVPAEQPAPINWDDLLDNNPESYFAEMQSKHGEKTEKRLNAVISAMQNQLDALNKAKPQTQDEIFENEERKELLQERIDKLNGMVARLTAPAVPEAPVEAAPVAETPTEPTETPAPADEVPAEPVEEPTPAPVAEIPEVPAEPAPAPEAPVAPTAPQPTPPSGVKIPKLNLKDIVTNVKKGGSEQLSGIHYEDGYAIASNGKVLVARKTSYPAENEGKTITPKGEEIDKVYPKWKMLLPEFKGKEMSFDIQDLYNFAMSVKSKYGKDLKYVSIGIKDNAGNDHFFTAEDIIPFLKAANEIGGELFTRGGSNIPIALMMSNGVDVAILQGQKTARGYNETYVATTTPTATAPEASATPVAPNPVANPVDEARKKERQLALNLKKIGLSPEAKQDLAYNAGKAVADMFATREEYDAYSETATDFGSYNSDFERGVEDSFANRQQNTGNPPVNSVPLENEPNGEDNGTEGTGASVRTNVRRRTNRGVRGATNGEGQGSDTGNSEEEGPKSQSENNKGKELVEDKYPVRKGNATGQLLVDTFGLDSVTIPDTQKKILNTIYDFMMEMSKTLGISPKSIGQGGWLNVRNKPTSRKAIASHEMLSNKWTGEITDVSLRFKYSRLSSIAHEWWHSLDRALSYFETGKKADTATSISETAFTGRKETWDAVQAIMKALNDSGYTDRIRNLVKWETPKTQAYFLSPTEQAARAFDQYISDRFAAAGIVIENYDNHHDVTQPTAEEMKVVTPAIENLFKVLQEKGGKKPGTSVLYHIGEMMEENNEAKAFATESILQMLKESGIEVDVLSNENIENMKALTNHNGIVYGWTDGKKIYLTEAGINPNTPVHEYTHLWAKAMMQKNPKGWNSIKQLLKNTPIWNEVMNDANYSNIHGNEDAVASEALSRISGTENAAKLEQMAQQMIDEAKGTMRKAEARGLIQNMRDALNRFWEFVWKDLFKMTYFRNVEHVTDRVLFDLLNNTDLGELSEGQVEAQIAGKMGAHNLDIDEELAEGVAYRMNALELAEQLESEGFDKNQIRTATGWERGYDGKWRYEIDDLVIKDNIKLKKGMTLGDIAENNKLFKAYPFLADIEVRKMTTKEIMETDADGAYIEDDNTIIVRIKNDDGIIGIDEWEVLVHEVQHAIQRYEGFTTGASESFVRRNAREILKEEEKKAKPLYDRMGERERQLADEMREEVYAQLPKRMSKRDKEIALAKAVDKAKFSDEAFESIRQQWLPYAKRIQTLKILTGDPFYRNRLEDPMVIWDLYKSYAGEVEARNAVNRMYLNDYERAEKTLEETEDTPREIQVAIGEASDVAESRKIKSEYYKQIPKQEFTVLANDLFARFTDKTIIGCIGHTANYFYLCDYFGDAKLPKVRAAFEIEANDDIKKEFFNTIYNETGISSTHLDKLLEESWLRQRGLSRSGNDIENRGKNDGNELVDSRQSSKGDFEGGLNESDAQNRWSSIKSGYDGSSEPRIRFVDESDLNIFFRTGEQNAAVDYLAGPQRNEVIQRAVNEEASKLGVSVTYSSREDMPKGHKSDKGYFNTETGEIVICTENNASIADAIQTILHEAVAHKGLRQLMGDKFNEFINRVYDSLDSETKAKVDALAESKYNGNTAVAMEEYMASLAETEDFANNSVWDKIKSAFENIINAILGRNDIKIGDNELRYILRASYNNMVNPRNMESIRGWARDQMMREEYNINHVAPELLSRTGIDPTEVATQTASLVYDQVVSDSWQEFQRQFQDAMQPVRIAIDAIQQETGNVPIEDYENYILIQNQSSSRSRVEIDDFARRYYSPIIEQVNKVIDTILESRGYDKNDREKRAEVYKEVKTYLIAKHGLERNAYYQTRNTRKITAKTKAERIKSVREDHKNIVDQIKNDPTLSPSEKANLIRQEKKRRDTLINQIRDTDYELDVRDYSGLTALFGFRPEQYLDAEAEAERCVENFENAIAIDELWAKIKSATDKTLRHSYESGLLSRQQYNDIKNMFEFYIPLRGFDESTAEDVYAYARFEGNRFNPAVQKAEGRTSLADDPIAIIMNMAESEIAQGNKNRAKQALYNYLLNRSDGMENQNSLMQIESVWAVKTVDAFGNEVYVIASPDHAAGETLEEFEERMQVMAEAGLAKKSQKGHVDVGMRFQKPSNKDAHYVYLKVNGVEKAIYINGNPKAADAINGTYTPIPSKTMQAVKDVQRLVSSTFTNYSLEFTARNYFRDMVYSHINIGVRESDPAYRKKFRQNWRHNNMRAMLKMLTAYRAGEYDGRPLTADEAAFVEFMNNGGQTGYTLINSVETHKKELERAIERMQNGIVKGGVKDSTIFRYTLGGIELLNEASELVTRFAAFKTSRDMGRGINRSINDAKEVTVNFNTKGAQDGTGWMGVVARYLGAVKYFFNASVQGVQNLGAAFQKNKLKFGSVVGGTIGLGMLMPVLQGALSELMGGDEDEYWNIPEYDRQNNLCFVIGKGKYVKLPLPIGFREMYGLGDLMMAGMLDKKFARSPISVGMDVANKIATIVLPINPIEGAANGLSLVESGQNMLLPDFLQGLVQNRTNTDFKGVPIQKEYTYNENDPQWTKAFANNPSWLIGLSKWCYEHLDIDGEGLDWSPEKLDNTFSNAFGGIYSLLKKTGRTVSAIWNEDNRTLSNVPLVGVIVGSNIDDDQRFVNSTYWEMDEYYNKRLYKIKSTAANFGLTLDDVFARNPEGERAGSHQPALSKIYNSDYFDFMQEWYLGHKGEGEVDENGNKILGLSQIKNQIKNLENKIKKNEDGVATPEQDEELVELNNLYEATRRDLVNDLLELD